MYSLTIKKLKKILTNKYENIFVLTGKNSYEKSGAKKYFKKIFKKKKVTMSLIKLCLEN